MLWCPEMEGKVMHKVLLFNEDSRDISIVVRSLLK